MYCINTEIFFFGSESWKGAGKLPTPLTSLKGVSINNKIIMTGGRGEDLFDSSNAVLNFNITSEQWEQVGEMTNKRFNHGASYVPVVDVIDFCSK